MSIYLLYRLREHDIMGFSGFEGRHYSLFENIEEDMGRAADLQNLLNVLAFKYIADGTALHEHIPDEPFVESERRQIIFGSATGIPTFFVRHDTKNLFLRKIIEKTVKVRSSRRYPGYLRVYNLEYRKALLKIIREDAADLIEMLGLEENVDDLALRLENPEGHAAAGKMARAILDSAGAKSPLQMKAEDFNGAAERFYRTDLKMRHIREGFRFLEEDLRRVENASAKDKPAIQNALQFTLNNQEASRFVSIAERKVIDEEISTGELIKLINLILISADNDRSQSQAIFNKELSERKMLHQYIERKDRRVRTEKLYRNDTIKFLYSDLREYAPFLFRALTGARVSRLLGFMNYEHFLGEKIFGYMNFLRSSGIDLGECWMIRRILIP